MSICGQSVVLEHVLPSGTKALFVAAGSAMSGGLKWNMPVDVNELELVPLLLLLL